MLLFLRCSVLIETYWNVKILYSLGTLPIIMRINRNILECKVVILADTCGYISRINRNILECKVKGDTMNNDQLTSINRNILECKAYINSYAPGCDMVLIETYWNVKS